MKNFFKQLIQYMLVSYLVLTIFAGIQPPEAPSYLIASLVILSIGMLFVSPMLKFLTIKENFVTVFVLSTLVCIGMFFLLDSFMTDFYIEEYVFEGVQIGTVIINEFEMTPTLTIAFASIIESFLGSLLFVLEKNS